MDEVHVAIEPGAAYTADPEVGRLTEELLL